MSQSCPSLSGLLLSAKLSFFEKAWEANRQNTIFAGGFLGLALPGLLSFEEERLGEVLSGINFDFCL